MDAHTRFQTQIVGALPVITHYLERIDLAATIDQLVPWEGDVPLGTLVEVLIANRLLQPKALFRVGQWAQAAAVTDYYGLTAEQLNDDRLGRALERLAEHAPDIQAALVLKAIEHFELDVTQIHYDLTTVELYGAYEVETVEGQPPPTPLPAYGRTKSGRKHIKQVQLGLDVTGDGGVPVGHLPLDGNAGEVSSHLENLRLLARTLPKGKLLYISDTKLDAPKNLLAIAARKGQFLCGGALLPNLQDRYLALRDQLRPVDYFPDSQAKLPPEERDRYEAVEVLGTPGGPGRRQVGPARLPADLRLERVEGAAGGHDPRAARGQGGGRVRGGAEEPGPVQPEDDRGDRAPAGGGQGEVSRGDAARLPAGAGRRRPLLPDLGDSTPRRCSGGSTWRGVRAEDQPAGAGAPAGRRCCGRTRARAEVERRFHHLKGPLAVAPMFLKNPERIAGLLCILVWALMVLALMERQVRRELKGQPLYGLYPEGRPSPAPTGPALIEGLSGLCVVIVHQGGETNRRTGPARRGATPHHSATWDQLGMSTNL